MSSKRISILCHLPRFGKPASLSANRFPSSSFLYQIHCVHSNQFIHLCMGMHVICMHVWGTHVSVHTCLWGSGSVFSVFLCGFSLYLWRSVSCLNLEPTDGASSQLILGESPASVSPVVRLQMGHHTWLAFTWVLGI